MKKATLINIPNPCGEKFENMQPNAEGAFCHKCQHNIIDLDNKEKTAILAYLLLNEDKSPCIRINSEKMDFNAQELIDSVKVLSSQSSNTNLPFYLLTMGALFIAGLNGNNTLKAQEHTANYEHSAQAQNYSHTDTIINPNFDPPQNRTYLGKFATSNTISSAEFKGGINALEDFIAENLVYPAQEKSAKIEGEIIISFIIQHDGRVTHPQVLNPESANPNFAQAAIDLVNKMPYWYPKKQGHIALASTYTLPIIFKIKD